MFCNKTLKNELNVRNIKTLIISKNFKIGRYTTYTKYFLKINAFFFQIFYLLKV